jgi:hypothetical protein
LKVLIRIFIVFAVTFCVDTNYVAAAITIVENGKSAYEIVISKNALPITVRAARDLQLYIEKSTGARLPIKQADTFGERPAIVVGDGPATHLLGIDLNDVKPEGFRIKTVDRNLVIAGRDTPGDAGSVHWRHAPQAGTWHGVSLFLQRALDIRWFFPGEQGEYVPKRRSLIVEEGDFADSPRLIYRRMTYLYDDKSPAERQKEVNDWLRRNRAGWSIVWQASHSWREYFPAEKYYKDHPDWFALVDGRRLEHSGSGLQICTANPAALDEFARVAVDYGTGNPGVMFSLSPNDGANFCECEKCRSLDHFKMPDGTPILSDRIVTYANEVARRVTRVLPNQTFGLYAYYVYSDPPLTAKPDPSINVMLVDNSVGWSYYSEAYREEQLRNRFMPWRAQTENLFFYTFPQGAGNMDLASMHAFAIEGLYRNLAAAGIRGIDVCVVDSFAGSGLGPYLYLNMAWDPQADFKSLYADAVEKCYGREAAPFVLQFLEILEHQVKVFSETRIKEASTGSNTPRWVFPSHLDLVYPKIYEDGRPKLEEAILHASDPGQCARVQMLLDNLEYTHKIVELYVVAGRVVGRSRPEVKDVLHARDLCEWVAQELKGKNDTNFHHSKYVDRIAGEYSLIYDAEFYNRLLLELMGGKSKATVRRISAPLELGWNDFDDALHGMDELSVNYRLDDASPAKLKTSAKFALSQGCLFIAVECKGPLAKAGSDNIGKNSRPDEIEILLAPPNSGTRYWLLSANSSGMVRSLKNEDNIPSDWACGAKVFAGEQKNSWRLTEAIPLSSFGITEVTPGDIWECNICRKYYTGEKTEYACWSPTFDSILQPGWFGYLIFY